MDIPLFLDMKISFTGVWRNAPNEKKTKLHKIYCDPCHSNVFTYLIAKVS